MKQKSDELLADLIALTRDNINEVEKLKTLDDELLNTRPTSTSWNVLECIEHLNLYSDFYLPELKKRVSENIRPENEVFVSGWLGDYFANSMKPKQKLNKMATFKDKNPIGKLIDRKVMDVFIDHQLQLIELLNRARNVSLNRTRCAISISKLIRLKLGDTFRFVIYHNQRHIVQAKKAALPDVQYSIG